MFVALPVTKSPKAILVSLNNFLKNIPSDKKITIYKDEGPPFLRCKFSDSPHLTETTYERDSNTMIGTIRGLQDISSDDFKACLHRLIEELTFFFLTEKLKDVNFTVTNQILQFEAVVIDNPEAIKRSDYEIKKIAVPPPTSKRILLIDGNNLLFRCFKATSYGKPEDQWERNNDGFIINGSKAFFKALGTKLKKLKPTHLLVCWDALDSTNLFRKELYPEYKAGRSQKEPAYMDQISYTFECLDRLNIQQSVSLDGRYEADDLIGTAVSNFRKEDPEAEIYIFSSDKDLFQLLQPNVCQIVKKKQDEVLYTDKLFKDKYELDPSQWIDAKAIVGDTSDNIKGIPNMGDKSLGLLKKYRTFDHIYENLAEIEASEFKRYTKYLSEGKEQGKLSKTLATLVVDVDQEELKSLNKCHLKINHEEKHVVFADLMITRRD